MSRYRDTKTGRFVSKKKWKRAKERESKRYKREREPQRKRGGGIVRPKPPKKKTGLREWFVSFSYSKARRTRVLDFYVIAATKERVIPLIYNRIKRGYDDKGFPLQWARLIRWEESEVTEIVPARRYKKERVEVH